MNWNLVWESLPDLLDGAEVTAEITFSAFFIGQVFALVLALARRSHRTFVRWPASVYGFVMRGTPLLVQIFLIYFVPAQIGIVRHSALWIVLRQPVACMIIAVGCNSAAYMAEVVAGSISALPKGQREAAAALGMSRVSALVKIVLPQVYRTILPIMSNEFILVLKASALASAVTLLDVTGIARDLVTQTYKPFEIFTIASLLYLAAGFLTGHAFQALEHYVAIPGSSTRPRTSRAPLNLQKEAA